MELLDELVRLAKSFEDRKVGYAVCGAIALLVHGIVRNTVDIDFLILESEFEDAKAAAAAAGFDFDGGWIPFSTAEAPRVFRLLKIEGSDYITLDLMLVTGPLQPVWTDRMQVDFSGTKLQVISKDSLIHMKSQSKRPKDLMDVESLKSLGGGSQ